ncbi:hypothetical protein QBC38DRAFT_103421 [Podospora fimiseda]|uniref:Uncharacterized protein n=1 Tax=Podospora fimiseda TaxID=252190 RepID=A0AAN7BTS8_9PEZI|nr:hypothetical protein QBC38DRAFT_103421 [Podospora fimiseda]
MRMMMLTVIIINSATKGEEGIFVPVWYNDPNFCCLVREAKPMCVLYNALALVHAKNGIDFNAESIPIPWVAIAETIWGQGASLLLIFPPSPSSLCRLLFLPSSPHHTHLGKSVSQPLLCSSIFPPLCLFLILAYTRLLQHSSVFHPPLSFGLSVSSIPTSQNLIHRQATHTHTHKHTTVHSSPSTPRRDGQAGDPHSLCQ